MATPEVKRGLQCDVERHLWKLGAVAVSIYTKISKLTWESQLKQFGTYHTSVEAMAEYLGADYSGTWRAFKTLEKNGWLEIVSETKNPYKSKNYRPVGHQQWAERHPDQCFKPETMTWDGERQDLLAQTLWKLSYGKTRWYSSMLKALRRSGKSDVEIARAWDQLVRSQQSLPTRKKNWRDLQFKFISEVKKAVRTTVPTTPQRDKSKIQGSSYGL